MKPVDVQHQGAADDEPHSIEIPVVELVSAIWQRRKWLAMVTAIGMVAALGIAFLIPNQYTSTAQIMAPDEQSGSDTSILGAGAAMFAGTGLLGSKTPGQVAIGILSSHRAENDIINRFDLKHVYHCKLYEDARNILSQHTVMEEDKKNGIVSIAVKDPDRYRAQDIAEGYVEELNKLLIAENTSSAHLERIFLEQRLNSLKSNLDAASAKLSQFSSRTATLNPQSQGASLISAAANLQSELISAQSELSGLKAQYSDDNVRVRSLQARIDELQSQLRKMGSVGEKQDGADLKTSQLYPSIRELPLLGATYSDLSRQLATQEDIYETLTKQYELAKVEEAKEIPTIKILDQPDLPERKSSPHRSIFAIIGAMLAAFGGLVWVITRKLWEITPDTNPIKGFVYSIMSSVQEENLSKGNRIGQDT